MHPLYYYIELKMGNVFTKLKEDLILIKIVSKELVSIRFIFKIFLIFLVQLIFAILINFYFQL